MTDIIKSLTAEDYARMGAAMDAYVAREITPVAAANRRGRLAALKRGKDVALLAAKGAKWPAVVIGAGPSLDASLGALRRYHDDAILIAVDTATSPLLAAGIEPDYVVTADPTGANARHLVGLQAEGDFDLIAEVSTGVDIARVPYWDVFWFQTQPYPDLESEGLRFQVLPSCGSVITSAASFAVLLGCQKIGFVGVDLGYPDWRPYCRNTIWEAGWQAQVTPELSLEAICGAEVARKATLLATDEQGRNVLTEPMFVLVRDWLIEQAKGFQQAVPGRSVVNLGATGLLYDPLWLPRATWAAWLART